MSEYGSRDWEHRYEVGDTPWLEQGMLESAVEAVKEHIQQPANVLEVGCGHGLEAIEIAKAGYNITAIDISATAIEQAKKNAEEVNIDFRVGDLLQFNPNQQFDCLLDIAVLHTYQTHEERVVMVKKMLELLSDNGYWINISCMAPHVLMVQESTGVRPPPALTQKELEYATDEHFNLVKFSKIGYTINREEDGIAKFPAWVAVLQRK